MSGATSWIGALALLLLLQGPSVMSDHGVAEGDGEVKVQPDIAQVRFSVNVQNPKLVSAQKQARELANVCAWHLSCRPSIDS
jgi:uncharacterized protein YggE